MSLPRLCRRCTGFIFEEFVLPRESVHYAERRCVACGSHAGWVAKPKDLPVSIVYLLRSNNLEDWEYKFLKSLACRSPNRSQEIVIRSIQKRVSSSEPSNGKSEEHIQLALNI